MSTKQHHILFAKLFYEIIQIKAQSESAAVPGMLIIPERRRIEDDLFPPGKAQLFTCHVFLFFQISEKSVISGIPQLNEFLSLFLFTQPESRRYFIRIKRRGGEEIADPLSLFHVICFHFL